MRRIRLRVAYDGTNYCGFQIQPDKPTIEGELNRALSELTHEDIHIIGASRTDSGVHAEGNVAVFDTASSIPAARFGRALAPFLPADIRVAAGDEVPADWHPRKQNCIKTYKYSISCGDFEDPLKRLYWTYSGRELDTEKMRTAAQYLIGEHDFTSFANPSSQLLMDGGSAVRTIYSIAVEKEAKQKLPYYCEKNDIPHNTTAQSSVYITVTGNGFLYNMVRIIAGTLINVGNGLWEAERVRKALLARDRTKAGPTAEARGLKLLEIVYPDEL